MSNTSPYDDLPFKVVEELELHFRRVMIASAAQRLWDRVLTEDDRQRLGGNLPAAYQARGTTVGMWMYLHGVSEPRAIADVARALGFLDATNYGALLRGIGEPQQESPRREVPAWHRNRGELRWRTRLIRRVRVMRNPSHIQRILDAFEAAGWPDKIENPIPGLDQHKLHQALASFNKELRKIRFHAQRGATEITWAHG